GSLALGLTGVFDQFEAVIALIVVWALLAAASLPIRQAYVNGLIPSEQRASILSFDSMLGSGGGVVVQPALGRSADVWSYATSYVIGAVISALAVPFVFWSRRQGAAADTAKGMPAETDPTDIPPTQEVPEVDTGEAGVARR
ncbi:MAG TPA: MFS transporter, partial [Thermoleophilaceae bacterium]|nr:MFS transporter [Thermoleophilaceae bacterium]